VVLFIKDIETEISN